MTAKGDSLAHRQHQRCLLLNRLERFRDCHRGERLVLVCNGPSLTKAREQLGWTPTTTLDELVAEMVAHDLEEARKEALLRLKGFNVVGAREA